MLMGMKPMRWRRYRMQKRRVIRRSDLRRGTVAGCASARRCVCGVLNTIAREELALWR
jgi:hypothetical protein